MVIMVIFATCLLGRDMPRPTITIVTIITSEYFILRRCEMSRCSVVVLGLIVLLLTVAVAGCNQLLPLITGGGESPISSLTITIKGRVVDAESGSPIEGVTITTDPPTISVTTASDGSFIIEITLGESESGSPSSDQIKSDVKESISQQSSKSPLKVIFDHPCYEIASTTASQVQDTNLGTKELNKDYPIAEVIRVGNAIRLATDSSTYVHGGSGVSVSGKFTAKRDEVREVEVVVNGVSFEKLSPSTEDKMFKSTRTISLPKNKATTIELKAKTRSECFASTTNIVVHQDSLAPAIAFTSHTSGAVVATPVQTVTWEASEKVGTTEGSMILTLNGVEEIIDTTIGVPKEGGEGDSFSRPHTFGKEVRLREGTNTLTVKAVDLVGLEGKSDDLIISLDTLPPVISGAMTSDVASTSAKITWATDEAATGRVDYGPTTAYGSGFVSESSLSTSHSLTLTNLSSATTYHYRITSTDALGHSASTTSDYTFKTLSPPIITGLTANPSSVSINATSVITLVVSDPDGDPLTHSWSTSGGSIASSGVNTAIYTAPSSIPPGGVGVVSVTVGDGRYSASATVAITITGAPANISLASGNGQSGLAGTALANPLVVIVKDASGNPVSGVGVSFSVTSGGGSLSATSALTGSDGKASTFLTLGSVAGANTVTAQASGLAGSPVTFSATGVVLGSISRWKF
jgi:hypothetical protein